MQSEMLVYGPDEKIRSTETLTEQFASKVFQTKKLYISWRYPGKGPTAFSALYPSLILAPAGLWLADERE